MSFAAPTLVRIECSRIRARCPTPTALLGVRMKTMKTLFLNLLALWPRGAAKCPAMGTRMAGARL